MEMHDTSFKIYTIIMLINRLKKGVSVSVFVTVIQRKPEYPQTEL